MKRVVWFGFSSMDLTEEFSRLFTSVKGFQKKIRLKEVTATLSCCVSNPEPQRKGGVHHRFPRFVFNTKVPGNFWTTIKRI